MGISTYVASRFYHLTINSPGIRTFIIGHEKAASRNLFQIVKRFHDDLPPELKPSIGVSNAEELLFDKIDSGYIVSTATLEGAGRSATAQLLDASEVAFWQDLPVQMAALLQIVPDMPGTEVILESTANSFNDFHALWRKAEAGESEFQPIFLPWFMVQEYRTQPAEDFVMTGEEKDLAERYELDAAQIALRRMKISQLPSPELFCQEYPNNAVEAFIASKFDSFIPPELVQQARRQKINAAGDLILGVDPAGMGADATAIAWRRGSCVEKVVKKRHLDTMQIAGWVVNVIGEDKPVRVNIDVSGMGVGVFDRLREQWFTRDVVQPVNFGGKPLDIGIADEGGKFAQGYANRRAEIWGNLRRELEGSRIAS